MSVPRTAYHEAGHAIIALHVGVGIAAKGVSIVPGKGWNGIIYFKKSFRGNPEFEFSEKMRLGMERRVLVALAGLAAQRKYRPSSVRRYQAAQDMETVSNLLEQLVGSPDELEAYVKFLELRVRNWVNTDRLWIQIEAVANELLRRKTLTAAETTQIASDAIANHIRKLAKAA